MEPATPDPQAFPYLSTSLPHHTSSLQDVAARNSTESQSHATPRTLDRYGSIDKYGSMLSSLGESSWEGGGLISGMRASYMGDADLLTVPEAREPWEGSFSASAVPAGAS